jgi:glycosyltransferase involved in cell wall biosynthesis
MKIAYIYPALNTIGGADRVITEKANYFAEQYGYEVYIITAHQNKVPISFPVSPKVTHIDLEVDFTEQYKYSFFKRGITYFKLLGIYKQKLSNLLNKLKVDFTITTISRDIDFLASLKDGSLKIAEAHVSKKFVRNNHLLYEKNILYKIAGKIWAYMLERNIKKFTELVVLTENDALNWKSIRSSTIICNSSPFTPKVKSECTNKKIISVGRLTEQKGFDMLIDAWEIVAQKHSDWAITVYGEGQLLDSLQQQINSKNLSASFKIEKFVKNISDKYTESSIYVMSSRFEGFGMVLIEAMSCGVPVISFDCPDGPSEIIRDNEDGFLVENGNIKQLAEKISFLIEDPAARLKMGMKAAENVHRYAPEIIMQKWVDLFEHLKMKQAAGKI